MNRRIIHWAGVAAVAAVGIAFIGGCASQGNSSVANSGAESDQVCSYNAPIGSHIGSRNCTSRSKFEAQQKAEHAQVQKNADTGVGAGTGGGRI